MYLLLEWSRAWRSRDYQFRLLTLLWRRLVEKGGTQLGFNSVFAYWGGDDEKDIHDFVRQWHPLFYSVRILKDRDVIFLLQKHFPEHSEWYDYIRIPSVRSDIARFLALFEFGGLYTDCHFGIIDEKGMKEFLRWAQKYDAVFVDNALWREKRRTDELLLITGFMFSQPGYRLLYDTCKSCLNSLSVLRDHELKHGFQTYNIWHVSGPGVLNQKLFLPGSPFTYGSFKQCYAKNIMIVKEEELPVKRNVHNGYRSPNQHWSERQKTERLFST